MKLGEISKDSLIHIAITRGRTSVSLVSEPTIVSDEMLFVKPFMHNDSYISFSSPDLHIEMMVVNPGEVPYFWKSVVITKEMVNGEIYHCIRSKLPGVKLNRRNSFRVYIGEHGTLIDSPGNGERDVRIKDISSNGISFVAKGEEESDFRLGDRVHLMYRDSEEHFIIDVESRIVRAEKHKAGMVYGCSFVKSYPQIDRYIATKQLKERAKHMTTRRR